MLPRNSFTVSLSLSSTSYSSHSLGLDNLPHEVAHLLQEIKHKERRAHGLSFSFKLCCCSLILSQNSNRKLKKIRLNTFVIPSELPLRILHLLLAHLPQNPPFFPGKYQHLMPKFIDSLLRNVSSLRL